MNIAMNFGGLTWGPSRSTNLVMIMHGALRRLWLGGLVPLCLGLFAMPGIAQAQYKNSSFGLDFSHQLTLKPTVVDNTGAILPVDKRPIRLSNTVTLGGESNFKMDHDRWWFVARVDVGFYRFAPNEEENTGLTRLQYQYDKAAADALGSILGIGGSIGTRYYIFTDKVRPYLQGKLFYSHFLSLTEAAETDCDVAEVCGGSQTNNAEFMRHTNVGGIGAQIGVEFIVVRDVAINFYGDYDVWLLLNAKMTHGPGFGLGITFYT